MDNNHTRGDDMNYLRVIIYMCIFGVFIYSQISFAETDEKVPFLINSGKCPDSQKLGRATSDKDIINELNTIIP